MDLYYSPVYSDINPIDFNELIIHLKRHMCCAMNKYINCRMPVDIKLHKSVHISAVPMLPLKKTYKFFLPYGLPLIKKQKHELPK